MPEPTREQDHRALDLASFYPVVEVTPPTEEDGPVRMVCYKPHERLPGRDDYDYKGMTVVASYTIDCDGREI